MAISAETSNVPGKPYLVTSALWAFVTIAHEPVLTREKLQAGDGHGVEESPLLSLPGRHCAPGGALPDPLPLEYPWAPLPQPGAEQKETNDLVIASAPKV